MESISRMIKTKSIFILGLICLCIIILNIWLYTITNAMVIVEPRQHELLQYVCENYDANMDSSWDLYVFHGKSNGDFAKESTRNIKKRNVYLLPLDTDNLNADQYNELFKQASFWNRVKAENILVFQTDSVLCPSSKYNIYNFTKYDYIGCESFNGVLGNVLGAWGNRDPEEYKKNHFYGVGGLSFRTKSFMMQCIRNNPDIKPTFPEDVFFSNCVAKSNRRPTDATQLAQFCSQRLFSQESFGAHKVTEMKKKNGDKHLQKFLQYCPAAKPISE